MTELESRAAYIAEMVKVARFLPSRYYRVITQMLPDKPLTRIKNARAGLVQDMDVLKALKKISEKERKRRQIAAKQELKATKLYA